MFFYLFTRFLFNPRLVLTELRVEQGGLLSLLAAFLSIAALTLSHLLVFSGGGGPLSWLTGSLAGLIVACAIAVFYLPVIHLCAERHMPGSRVSDLMIYAGFILSPLLFTLPLAFIFLLFPAPWLFQTLATLAIFASILVALVDGVRINYHLKTGPAILVTAAPVLLLILVPLIVAALIVYA